MSTFHSAQGLPVIDTETAEEIGTVEHFVVGDGRVRALHVGGGRGRSGLLDWSDIDTFGDDAVMIADGELLREPRDDVEQRAARGDLDMVGKRALSEDGDEVGTVTDVHFDGGDGTIIEVTVDDDAVSGDRLSGVGDFAVVILRPATD